MRKLLLVVCLTLCFYSWAFAAGSSDFTIFWSRASPSISVEYDIVLDPSGLVILKSDTEVYGDLNVLGYLKTESDYLCDSSDCYLISDLNMYSGADGNGMSWIELDGRYWKQIDLNAILPDYNYFPDNFLTWVQPMMNKGLVDANFSENMDWVFTDYNQITNADNNTGWTLGNDAISIVAESELKKEGEGSLKVVVDVDSTPNVSSFVDLLLPEILDLNVLGLADGNISVWVYLPEGVEVVEIGLQLYNSGVPVVGNAYNWYEPPEGGTPIRSGWVKYTQNIQEAYNDDPDFDTTDINYIRLSIATLSASDFDWYFDDIRITNYQPVDGNFNAVKAYKFFGLLDTINLLLGTDFNAIYKGSAGQPMISQFLWDGNFIRAFDANVWESEDFNAAYKTTSTTYYPSALKIIYGTDQTNDINAAKYYDLNAYVVNEAAGANPLTIDINFTNVSDLSQLVFREYYDGSSSHTIKFQIWDYNVSDWEDYFEIKGQSGYSVIIVPVFDPEDHTQDNLVQVKISHQGTGVTGHVFNLDFVWLIEGINVGASTNLIGYARYVFGDNDFNGTGDFNTTGDINAGNISLLALKNCTVKTGANGNFYCGTDNNGMTWTEIDSRINVKTYGSADFNAEYLGGAGDVNGTDINVNSLWANALTVNGTITSTGVLSVAANTEATNILGRVKIGDVMGTADVAGFAHFDNANATDYALLQGAAGWTILNAKAGQSITLRVNNAVVATVGAGALTVDGAGNFSSIVQITGGGTPPSGIGMELEYDAGYSDILSYNRDDTEYVPFRVRASTIEFCIAGTTPELSVASTATTVRTAIIPDAASGANLGSTAAEWENLYIGTGRTYYGATQAGYVYDTGTYLEIGRS